MNYYVLKIIIRIMKDVKNKLCLYTRYNNFNINDKRDI